MATFNPAKILREIQKEKNKITAVKAQQAEAKELFRERIIHAFKDNTTRGHFVELLKAKNITARDMMSIAERLGSSIKQTNEWFLSSQKTYNFQTLQDVKDKSVIFFKVMIIARDEYAPDVALDITFRVAAEIVLEHIVLCS